MGLELPFLPHMLVSHYFHYDAIMYKVQSYKYIYCRRMHIIYFKYFTNREPGWRYSLANVYTHSNTELNSLLKILILHSITLHSEHQIDTNIYDSFSKSPVPQELNPFIAKLIATLKSYHAQCLYTDQYIHWSAF